MGRRSEAAAALAPLVERIERKLGGPADLAVRLWDGSEIVATGDGPPRTTLVARGPRALEYVVREPNQLGLGRAWVSGELDVEGELEDALSLGERFQGLRLDAGDRLAALAAAWRLGAVRLRRPPPPESEPRLQGHRHSLRRDRVAVRHHYDVSNDFYRLLLGPSLVYSCAYFASPDDTLEEAQERKLDLICRKLRLEPGERLLDVGCGWGSLLLHAAAHYGVRAVGVTLSEPQAELARERIQEAGLADRCEVRVADYRELDDGTYDKVASVGMYEHVGRARLVEYAAQIRALLRPGGLFLNHGIVRPHPERWSRHTFLARYVFPDGELHPPSAVARALEEAGLELRDAESLREHYALTLRRWTANLAASRERAVAEVGEQRERIWRLYMTGGALSFDRGESSVIQVLAAAPGASHGLPLARAQLLEPAASV